MYSLECIEQAHKIKFPKEYKQLYQSNFKEIDSRIKIYEKDAVFWIKKFLNTTQISEVLDELYEFLGYDIIPIAEVDYDDYICLYYGKNRENPSIVYWSYELALENPEEGIIFLYDSMQKFKNKLKRV